MLALAFLLPVAVGWGIYEIFSPEDDNSKSANDEYIGTEDPNNLDGRAGNDTLNGLEGKDTLDCGYGNDVIDGADTLYGGPGDDVLHIASDDLAYDGEGSDEFNVHTSQMLVSACVPVIEFFEPTEDRIVITYDPTAFSGTPPVTYTVSADQVVVNLNGSAVATLPGSYTEAQIASQVSLQQQNPTLVTS